MKGNEINMYSVLYDIREYLYLLSVYRDEIKKKRRELKGGI